MSLEAYKAISSSRAATRRKTAQMPLTPVRAEHPGTELVRGGVEVEVPSSPTQPGAKT